MLSYFARFNFHCPDHYNPADFALRLAQKESDDSLLKSGMLTHSKGEADAIRSANAAARVHDRDYPVVVQSPYAQQLYQLTVSASEYIFSVIVMNFYSILMSSTMKHLF